MDFDEVLKVIPVSLKILNLSDNNINKLSINSLSTTKLEKPILNNNKILESDLEKYQ